MEKDENVIEENVLNRRDKTSQDGRQFLYC